MSAISSQATMKVATLAVAGTRSRLVRNSGNIAVAVRLRSACSA